MATDSVVFVVDDDDAVRTGLEALLSVKGFAVRSFASAEAFLASLSPDVDGCVLADVRMPGMSGLELQRELIMRDVGLPVVIITGHGDIPMAVSAIKAGAVDFIEKPFDAPVILSAVDEALRRSPGSAQNLARDREAFAQRLQQLSPREREVMELVVGGHPNKVIAHRLGIALRTVEIHRARIMEKTGARNLSELVRMVVRFEELR
ncbi:MAG: response regulator transcription factor [Rhodospirillales bacterium]